MTDSIGDHDASSNSAGAPPFASATAKVPATPLATRRALEKMRPHFAAITREQLQTIRLDLPTMGMWVLQHLDGVAPYREQIAQLPFVNHEYITHLESGALALLEADSQARVAAKVRPEVVQTYREAAAFRDEKRAEAKILVRRKLLPEGCLDVIAGARGYRNTAVELMALGTVLRDHFDAIVGRCAITLDEVNRCAALAQVLYRCADDRFDNAAVPAPLVLLRHQAYTWLMLAYQELRRCLTFLVTHATMKRIAPSFFESRGGNVGRSAGALTRRNA